MAGSGYPAKRGGKISDMVGSLAILSAFGGSSAVPTPQQCLTLYGLHTARCSRGPVAFLWCCRNLINNPWVGQMQDSGDIASAEKAQI